MLNLSKSEDYNKMVKDIEKLMVFKLDTTATEEKTYLIMLQDYKANGFDEYAVMTGGKTNFQIFGKEEKTNEFVGVIKSEKDLYIFYMLGMIDFIKIPSLIQSIQSGDMLNIFTLNSR